jgi:hypothetical protein
MNISGAALLAVSTNGEVQDCNPEIYERPGLFGAISAAAAPCGTMLALKRGI